MNSLPHIDADQGDHIASNENKDRRHSERQRLVLRSAKVSVDDIEHFCVVRDISDHGLSLNLFGSLPDVGQFHVEFPSGQQVKLRKIWHDGDRAGFQFCEPVDLAKLLAEREAPYPSRPIRLSRRLNTIVTWDGCSERAEIINISQSGSRLSLSRPAKAGDQLRIKIPGLDPMIGTVRWVENGEAGIMFDRKLEFSELGRWSVEQAA